MLSARARRDLLVLAGYLILALILTYPLVLHFTTHVAGDGSDDPALAWNLWWVPHALFNLGTSPIYTDYLFYPIGLNLAFYTLTYLNAFIAVPIQFVFGLIPAANVNLLLSFTLSGFGTYLLVQYLLRAGMSVDGSYIKAPAFIAGLLYAFSSNKFLYASLGQFNIASSQWIPFYILFLVKLLPPHPQTETRRRRTLKYGLLLGLFLLFQALSEFIFASFLILFSIAYLVYWLINNHSGITNYKLRITSLLLAVLTFLLPMSPILAAMIADMQAEGDFIQSGLGFSNIFSGDLLGLFIPSQLHPLLGGLQAQFHFPYINFVYLGYVTILLALVALWRVPRARIWGLWFALVLLITLGPTLRVNGTEYDLPFLPFNLLLQIPFIKGNRYPSRWSVMLTLCLAILVGYGIAELVRILNSKFGIRNSMRLQTAHSKFRIMNLLLPLMLGLLLLFEHLSVPLPLTDFRVPEAYAAIAQDPGDFAVMELPLTWRNGFRVTGSYRADSQAPIDREFMLAQWYQTAQGHPVLNGNTSRNPELKFQYFAETPVVDSLIAIQTGYTLDDATWASDKDLAPGVLQFFGIRYIIWHTPYEEVNRDVANRTRAYVEQTFPVTKVSESYVNGRGMVVYRVNLSPTGNATIRPNDPLARLYFGEGWSAVGQETIWVERDDARMFFSLSSARPVRLTLSFVGGSEGPMGVSVNGHLLPAVAGATASPEEVRDVPAAYLRAGANELTLHFNRLLPLPQPDAAQTPLPIGQTGIRSPVSILVRSAGEEQGNFGHIYVQGVDESPNRRGYNLVVVDPRTGTVEGRANFDVLASGENAARLAAWMAAIPDGKIVAVAAADEASSNLTVDAVAALQSIGGAVDLRSRFRWSHALIGVKGARPGTAMEAASETRVSQLILGVGATSPRLGPALAELKIEASP